MSEIRLEDVPPGSKFFRLWVGSHHDGVDPIDTVGLILRRDSETAVIEGAHGTLPPDGLLALGLKLFEEGYRTLYFKALKKVKVTHYAEVIGEDDQFQFCKVALDEQVRRYLEGVAV